MEKEQSRGQVIIRTSIIGILTNVVLAGFKAVVGLLSNSIAIVLDAVNNLSDALSSLITIIGAKLAGKKPDKNHPLGYGRVEYLSGMVVSGIVIYAGLTSAFESVRKLIFPEAASYDTRTLVILGVAIVVKIVLGRYVKAQGEKVDSDSLTASGADALNDALVSGSVLLSAVIFLLTGLSLEAFVGILIAVIIIRSGIEMLRETLNKFLGSRMDHELTDAIKTTICEVPGVHGAYDLILHSYGPEHLIGSVHIEVDDTMTAAALDHLEREISAHVLQEHHVYLAGIGIYSRNTGDDGVRDLENTITRVVGSNPGVLQMHGFYVNEETKEISFDVILDFALKDRNAAFAKIREEVEAAAPGYTIQLNLDLDI